MVRLYGHWFFLERISERDTIAFDSIGEWLCRWARDNIHSDQIFCFLPSLAHFFTLQKLYQICCWGIIFKKIKGKGKSCILLVLNFSVIQCFTCMTTPTMDWRDITTIAWGHSVVGARVPYLEVAKINSFSFLAVQNSSIGDLVTH